MRFHRQSASRLPWRYVPPLRGQFGAKPKFRVAGFLQAGLALAQPSRAKRLRLVKCGLKGRSLTTALLMDGPMMATAKPSHIHWLVVVVVMPIRWLCTTLGARLWRD